MMTSLNTKNKFWLVTRPTWSTIQGVIEQRPVGGQFEIKSIPTTSNAIQSEQSF